MVKKQTLREKIHQEWWENKKRKNMKKRNITIDTILETVKEEINKTHDGTSMGTMGPILTKWTKENIKYGDLIERITIFDETGKERGRRSGRRRDGMLACITDDDVVYGEDKWVTGPEFARKNGLTDIHYAETSASGQEGEQENGINIKESGQVYLHGEHSQPAQQGSVENEHPYNDSGTRGTLMVPNNQRLDQLCEKNEDGEYLMRSYSLASRNGTRITATRSDSFGPENEAAYKELTKNMTADTKAYEAEYEKTYKGIAQRMIDNHEYPDTIKGHEIMRPRDVVGYVEHKAQQEAQAKMGTWEDNVFKGKGYDQSFKDVGVKITVNHQATENKSRYSCYNDRTWSHHDGINDTYNKTGLWGEEKPWKSGVNGYKVKADDYKWNDGNGYVWRKYHGETNWVSKKTDAYKQWSETGRWP